MGGSINKSAATIGWGVYCACSWTWCIGMYLPIIMLHRYGWPGFLVFAIPNVLGCAAMGYIVRTRQRSEAMIARHRPAMIVFSLVTIAFQLFFVAFIMMRIEATDAISMQFAIVMPIGILGVGATLGLFINSARLWLLLALTIFMVSLVAFTSLGTGTIDQIAWSGERPWIEIALLAPTIVFGFLLCPYLDLTFHRALQESPSRHCFAVFGVTFAAMIVFTCAYWTLRNHPIEVTPGFVLTDTGFLVAHLFGQLLFTVAVHIRELRIALGDRKLRDYALIFGSPLLVIPLLILAAVLNWSYAANESMYLRWLVFYGLIFPAYVLVFIGPWRAKRMTTTNLAQLAVAIIAFIPLYELGFIHHWSVAVLPPVLLLILAVVVTPGTATKIEKAKQPDSQT